MKKTKLQIQWSGTFIELCTGRVNRSQKKKIEEKWPDRPADAAARWYENQALLADAFQVDNWWSIDDLDHAMGLVFADRAALDTAMAEMTLHIDGQLTAIDPDAVQLSVYAPEAIELPDKPAWFVSHGASRKARLTLDAEFSPPFDPTLITLSLIQYPDHGLVLIDLDYDGHDDVQLSVDSADYLEPQFTDTPPF